MTGKIIVVFGVTEAAQVAVTEIRNLGMNISYMIDNDPIWHGRRWSNIPVIMPTEISVTSKLFLISCTPYVMDKIVQLKQIGIHRRQCLIITPEKRSMIGVFVEICVAERMLYRLKGLYGTNLLLCPYPGTGDAFLTGRYLQNLLDRLGWKQYTILATSKAFLKVMRLYGYENCVVISKKDCERLKLLIKCYGMERTGVYYLLYWGLSIQSTFRLENHFDLSFNDIFSKTVFGNEKLTIRLPSFNTRGPWLQKTVVSHSLKKNRTVILAPSFNSFQEELTREWWEELVLQLNQLGFAVATNCGSGDEKEIAGTERLELPYECFPAVAEYCGVMLGVRSGLFDLMSAVSCKKIIIYPDFISRERMNFFSLKNMGLCSDAVELKLENSPNGKKELTQKILNILGEHNELDE